MNKFDEWLRVSIKVEDTEGRCVCSKEVVEHAIDLLQIVARKHRELCPCRIREEDVAQILKECKDKAEEEVPQAAFGRGKMLSKEAHCEKHGWACTKCDSCVKEAQIDEKKLAARIAESLSTFFKAGHMGYRSSSYNPDKEAKEVIEHARKA